VLSFFVIQRRQEKVMSSKRRVLASAFLAISVVSYAGETKPALSNNSIIDTVVDCATAVANPVANCGFETGDFTGWIQSGDPTYTTVDGALPHSGAFALTTGPGTSLGCITQYLDTPTFSSYNLSFWRQNTGQPNELQVYWNGSLVMDWSYVADVAYQQVSFQNLPTPGATTELDFCFYNPPSYFHFDDVVASGH